MATLVLTVIGNDQAGLVDALSGVIAHHGGSWRRSHMAQLAGKFAGIVEVKVPDASVDSLVSGLQPLEAQGLLDVTATAASDDGPPSQPTVAIEIVGVDRVGIVHEVTATLASNGINIVEIETTTEPAAMAGGAIFSAQLRAEIDASWTAATVADELHQVQDALGLDISVVESR